MGKPGSVTLAALRLRISDGLIQYNFCPAYGSGLFHQARNSTCHLPVANGFGQQLRDTLADCRSLVLLRGPVPKRILPVSCKRSVSVPVQGPLAPPPFFLFCGPPPPPPPPGVPAPQQSCQVKQSPRDKTIDAGSYWFS